MKVRMHRPHRELPLFVFCKKAGSLPLFISLCLIIGCGKPTPAVTTLSEAHQKFLKVCQEDGGINPVIKPLENTLYVYLPIEHEIMMTKANGMMPLQSPKAKNTKSVLYIDGEFQENRFSFVYDISGNKSYPNEMGYGYAYHDEYKKKDAALFRALLRAYGDIDETHLPGDVEFGGLKKTLTHEEVVHYKGKKLSPDFIVLIIADIKNGIVTKKTFSFTDYRLTAFGTLPGEEFLRRQIFDVVGSTDIIGDQQGEHIEYNEITWPNFLTRQIIHRVKYQYQHSAFPPKGDAEDAILSMAYTAFEAYSYKNFDSIELNNLVDDKTYLFDRKQLGTFKE